MLYGRSLSGCLYDILIGKIDPTWVGAIVCGTSALSEDRFIALLQYYSVNELQDWAYREIRRLGMRLFRTGKIIQPRAFDEDAIQNSFVRGKWTDSLVAAFATIADHGDVNSSPLDYVCQGCETFNRHNCCSDPYCREYDHWTNTIARSLAPKGYIKDLSEMYAQTDEDDKFEY